MARWCIQTLAYEAPSVFEAALAAAADLGFGVAQVDRPSGRFLLEMPRPLGAPAWPVEAVVLDNGLGSTSLRVSWDLPGTAPWLPPTPRHKVNRLQHLTRLYLHRGELD